MFSSFKNAFKKVYTTFTSKAQSLFSRTSLDEATLKELEQLLIEADTGVATTRAIIQSLEKQFQAGTITQGDDLRTALHAELLALLHTTNLPASPTGKHIFFLIGINGSGKTTCASKLTYLMQQQNKRVLLVAGDTFRAAATEQLRTWAERSGTDIVIGKHEQEPASVIFTACEQFKNGNYDVLIVDTAGRLQNNINLMRELEKMKRIATRQLPEYPITTLLTVDAMLGQSSFDQAKLFHASMHIDGIMLTKMDGTGKGGIACAIAKNLQIPIAYISFGEQMDQFKPFDATAYVDELLTRA